MEDQAMSTNPHASILARITRYAPERVPCSSFVNQKYRLQTDLDEWVWFGPDCTISARTDDAHNAVELAGLACLLDNGWWLHKLPDGRFRVLPDLNYALAVSGPTIAHAIDAALAHVWKETP
jgi:hypothetical protein